MNAPTSFAPIIAEPAEAPFATYVADAHAQIASTRANSDWLNGTRAWDHEIARALAILNRASDRSDAAKAVRK